MGALPRAVRAEVVITPQEKWTNVFAEQKITLHLKVDAKDGFEGRLLWTFAATNGSIFSGGRGEAAVTIKEGKATEVKVPLKTPSVKAGVVLAGILKITAVKKGQAEPEGTFERKFWIFPDNPFVDRDDWLKKLEISVFDPTNETKTVKLLTELKIPHEAIQNLAALEELKKGFVVIGEGVSFRDERGLDEIINKLAKRGLPVLCLAPENGMILLPGTGENDPVPDQLRWRKQEIITELDKRLDVGAWMGAKTVVLSSLVVKADEGKVVGEVTAGPKGWPWLEVDYANQGKLVVVGFPVISQWGSSPTPRYLFARLLEYVTERTQQTEEKRSTSP